MMSNVREKARQSWDDFIPPNFPTELWPGGNGRKPDDVRFPLGPTAVLHYLGTKHDQ